MTEEIWKAIPGFEGLYEASTEGRIRSLPRQVPCRGTGTRISPGKILARCPNTRGYVVILLYRDGTRHNCMAHNLIALTFFGDSKLTVNHKNEVKSDNRLSNLEYLSLTDNIRYSAKLTMDDANTIRKMYATGDYTQYTLATLFNVSRANIGFIVNNQRWAV